MANHQGEQLGHLRPSTPGVLCQRHWQAARESPPSGSGAMARDTSSHSPHSGDDARQVLFMLDIRAGDRLLARRYWRYVSYWDAAIVAAAVQLGCVHPVYAGPERRPDLRRRNGRRPVLGAQPSGLKVQKPLHGLPKASCDSVPVSRWVDQLEAPLAVSVTSVSRRYSPNMGVGFHCGRVGVW